MKICNLNLSHKFVFAVLCGIFLTFKVEGTDLEQELLDIGRISGEKVVHKVAHFEEAMVDVFKVNSRKAIPEFINFTSLLLGSLASLKSFSIDASKSCGSASACCSLVGAVLNTYNWYTDRDEIRGKAHNILNALGVLSNICSIPFSFLAAYTNPYEDNTYSVIATIIGGSAMLFKGLDLFLMTSPIDDYKCKLASRSEPKG